MSIISRRAGYLMLACVLLLMIIPLAFVAGEYGGADDAATAVIENSVPGYKPWFTPIWSPPSPEIESLLFALQAAIGAGVIGYVLGRIQGAAKAPEVRDPNGRKLKH